MWIQCCGKGINMLASPQASFSALFSLKKTAQLSFVFSQTRAHMFAQLAAISPTT